MAGNSVKIARLVDYLPTFGEGVVANRLSLIMTYLGLLRLAIIERLLEKSGMKLIPVVLKPAPMTKTTPNKIVRGLARPGE